MKPLHTHWRTREGALLTPQEMDTDHLRNALNLCARTTRRVLLQQSMRASFYAFASTTPQHASDAAMSEADQLIEAAYNDAACREYALEAWPVTRIMEAEVLKRTAISPPSEPSLDLPRPPFLDLLCAFPDGAEIHRDDWPEVEALIARGAARWLSSPRGPGRNWRRAAAC